MYYTENIQRDNSAFGKSLGVPISRPAKMHNKSDAVGTLTNYKTVVDIDKIDLTSYLKERHQIVHYGLSSADLEEVEQKLKRQKQFLEFSYLYDRINQNAIPLSDLLISANHSTDRYYAEVQNRVNTLTAIAKQRELKPLFMTLTLPSEFHKYKKPKHQKIKKELISNPKYNGTPAKDAVKILTKMFAKLRHDRSLKELSKEQRIYFRVNEPHKDGTPHTHILMFVPADRVERVKKAFKRLFFGLANNIQDDIENATSYVMKYINKTLPLSKQKNLSQKDKYLNAWYSKNRVIRFNSSKTLAPLNFYRLLHQKYSLFALTRLISENHFKIYVTLDTNKVMEVINEWGDVVYARGSNFDVVTAGNHTRGDYSQNNLQTSESAIGMRA